MENVLRFSATDRDAIRKHVIGQPTGTIVTIGGLDFNLVPITVEQSGTVFEILDSILPLWNAQDNEGTVNVDKGKYAEVLAREGKRTTAVIRSVLHGAALASDLIDESDGGEAVFAEWFVQLPLVDVLRTLLPKFIEAQGLTTLLGNASPPPTATT